MHLHRCRSWPYFWAFSSNVKILYECEICYSPVWRIYAPMSIRFVIASISLLARSNSDSTLRRKLSLTDNQFNKESLCHTANFEFCSLVRVEIGGPQA